MATVKVESPADQTDVKNPNAYYPMYNPLLLEKILGFLPLEPLKECRQVSSSWHHLTYPHVQKQAWVTLSNEDSFRFSLKDFLTFVEQNYEKPQDAIFRNYKLNFHNLTESNMTTSRIPEFWIKFGSLIETLHLKRCIIDKGMLDRFISSTRSPNLTHLILNECPFTYNQNDNGDAGYPEPEKDFGATSSLNNIRKLTFHSDKGRFAEPFELQHFWTMFPKVKDLSLIDLSEEQTLKILDAAVEHRRSTGQPIQVTKLNIFGEEQYSIRKVPEMNISLLCNSGFPLTRLEVDIGENIQEAEFAQLLRSFRSTLEVLVIWRGLMAQQIRGFPYNAIFPRLSTLRIPESCLEDMAFLRFMRNLKNLAVLQCDLEPMAYPSDIFRNRNELDVGGVRELTPLHSLQFFKMEYQLTETDIEFLRRIFPKLTRLSAFLQNEFITRHY